MTKTTWIIIGVAAFLVILYMVFSSKKTKALKAQMERERIQSQMTAGGSGSQNGLTGTLDSVGGVLDAFSNLFTTIKKDDQPSLEAREMAIEAECWEEYPTDPFLRNMCYQQKMAALA